MAFSLGQNGTGTFIIDYLGSDLDLCSTKLVIDMSNFMNSDSFLLLPNLVRGVFYIVASWICHIHLITIHL